MGRCRCECDIVCRDRVHIHEPILAVVKSAADFSHLSRHLALSFLLQVVYKLKMVRILANGDIVQDDDPRAQQGRRTQGGTNIHGLRSSTSDQGRGYRVRITLYFPNILPSVKTKSSIMLLL